MPSTDLPLRLRPESTLLLVVDIQERLAQAMPDLERELCIHQATTLVRSAGLLGVPVMVTEQYPKGLGPTVEPLRKALEGLPQPEKRVEKVEFDACRSEPFLSELAEVPNARSVILAGMEAHICVYQTARSLVSRGLDVHIALDATCSRSLENRRIAESLWSKVGATVTCTETVLFDLLGRASGDTFKAISKMVR
jgi:nicotinamidase-related amidase